MSHFTNSSIDVKFAHPEYFVQSGSLDEWYCSICTPLRRGNIDYMTLKTAQHHERHSAEHLQNVADTERRKWILSEPDPEAWDGPLTKGEPELSREEIKMRESRLHVDLVRDMVPFWIRGVEAAERGEVLRLEDFLAKLEESTSEWGGGDGNMGWDEQAGDGGWGNQWSNHEIVQERKGKQGRRRKVGRQDNAYKFVEDVARQEAADEERRRRMHRFFEMPTDEKVRKIDEAIRALVAVTS